MKFFSAILLLFAVGAQAQIQINQLPPAQPLTGTESIAMDQGNCPYCTVRTTPAAIASYAISLFSLPAQPSGTVLANPPGNSTAVPTANASLFSQNIYVIDPPYNVKADWCTSALCNYGGGSISSGSTTFTSVAGSNPAYTFTSADVGKVITIDGAGTTSYARYSSATGSGSPGLVSAGTNCVAGTLLTVSGGTGTAATIREQSCSLTGTPSVAAAGSGATITGATFTGTLTQYSNSGYGATLTVSGVTGTIVIGQNVVGTGVPANTIITSGSGTTWYVNQSVAATVGPVSMTARPVATGTTGTGLRVQYAVTISGGGIGTIVTPALSQGYYVVNPTTLSNEPVTVVGAGGLTGAALNLGTMGIYNASLVSTGAYTATPSNPVSVTGSDTTPTFNMSYLNEFTTTIASVSGGQATLAASSPHSVSGAGWGFGTDNTTGIQNAINAAQILNTAFGTGYCVQLPAGSMLISSSIAIGGSVCMSGVSPDATSLIPKDGMNVAAVAVQTTGTNWLASGALLPNADIYLHDFGVRGYDKASANLTYPGQDCFSFLGGTVHVFVDLHRLTCSNVAGQGFGWGTNGLGTVTPVLHSLYYATHLYAIGNGGRGWNSNSGLDSTLADSQFGGNGLEGGVFNADQTSVITDTQFWQNGQQQVVDWNWGGNNYGEAVCGLRIFGGSYLEIGGSREEINGNTGANLCLDKWTAVGKVNITGGVQFGGASAVAPGVFSDVWAIAGAPGAVLNVTGGGMFFPPRVTTQGDSTEQYNFDGVLSPQVTTFCNSSCFTNGGQLVSVSPTYAPNFNSITPLPASTTLPAGFNLNGDFLCGTNCSITGAGALPSALSNRGVSNNKPFNILASGQSNQVGNGEGGNLTINQTCAGIYVWNDGNGPTSGATAAPNPTVPALVPASYSYYPLYHTLTGGYQANTPSITLASTLRASGQVTCDRPINVFLIATGGLSIENWEAMKLDKVSTLNGKFMMASIVTALVTSAIDHLDLITWIQGEDDGIGTTHDTYSGNAFVNNGFGNNPGGQAGAASCSGYLSSDGPLNSGTKTLTVGSTSYSLTMPSALVTSLQSACGANTYLGYKALLAALISEFHAFPTTLGIAAPGGLPNTPIVMAELHTTFGAADNESNRNDVYAAYATGILDPSVGVISTADLALSAIASNGNHWIGPSIDLVAARQFQKYLELTGGTSSAPLYTVKNGTLSTRQLLILSGGSSPNTDQYGVSNSNTPGSPDYLSYKITPAQCQNGVDVYAAGSSTHATQIILPIGQYCGGGVNMNIRVYSVSQGPVTVLSSQPIYDFPGAYQVTFQGNSYWQYVLSTTNSYQFNNQSQGVWGLVSSDVPTSGVTQSGTLGNNAQQVALAGALVTNNTITLSGTVNGSAFTAAATTFDGSTITTSDNALAAEAYTLQTNLNATDATGLWTAHVVPGQNMIQVSSGVTHTLTFTAGSEVTGGASQTTVSYVASTYNIIASEIGSGMQQSPKGWLLSSGITYNLPNPNGATGVGSKALFIASSGGNTIGSISSSIRAQAGLAFASGITIPAGYTVAFESGSAARWDVVGGSYLDYYNPLMIGGNGGTSSLVLESTSAAGTTDAIVFKTGSQTEAMRITTTQSVLFANASSHSGQAACFTTSGKLGYCTTVVSSSGGCTCTGL